MRNKRKDPDLHTVTIEQTIPLANGSEIEAILNVSIRWVNNGIGAYEYWGAKCVDNQYEWELYDVALASHPEHTEEIDRFIEENEDTIKEAAISKFEYIREAQ